MNTEEKYKELQKQLLDLADRVQKDYQDNDQYHREIRFTLEKLERIYAEISDLQRNTSSIVTSLDKDHAIQGEKNSNVFFQLEQLERRLEDLERNAEKNTDSSRQFVEKVVMLIIGGLVTWLFSALQN